MKEGRKEVYGKDHCSLRFFCRWEKEGTSCHRQKSEPPRFTKVCTLAVRHAANASAWTTRKLFAEWLKEWDRKLGREGKNSLLLVDSCPAPDVTNTTPRSIRVGFPSRSTASILQPCDQGIVRAASAYFGREMPALYYSRLKRGAELLLLLLQKKTASNKYTNVN